jgi:hypothetical protein
VPKKKKPTISGPGEKLAAPGSENWLKRLAPGLVTGASDDDPTGIGTYGQAGAQLGLERGAARAADSQNSI